MEELLAQVAARMGEDARVTVLTGAGVSAASGVRTFRDPGGLWHGMRPEEVATPEAFACDPRLCWEWYEMRRRQIAACEPNPAHEVIARWARQRPGFRLVTQNVDGLHERAGTPGVVRFHGSIWHLSCAARCAGSPAAWEDRRVPLPELPPACPACGGIARPAVVWFGEGIDPRVILAAREAVECEVFLAVGTSAVVFPAAGMIGEARRAGALVVEVNPETSAGAGEAQVVLRGGAEVVLPRLDALLPA